MKSITLSFTAILGLALMAGYAAAADDDIPTFAKRGDMEKAFVAKVGTAIVKAARSKPQKVEMDKYEFDDPKKGRKELKITMTYAGLISKQKFTANIVVLIDSSDKEKWEVLNIKYKDDNKLSVSPSEKNIQALIEKFNGKKK
jgi:hypothetical protein